MEAKELLFGDILETNVKRNPENIAISEKTEKISYRELQEKVSDFAVKMSKIGIGKGTHVMLWSVNSISWVVAFFAMQKLGAIACLMNYGLKSEDAQNIVKMSDGEYLFFGIVAATSRDADIAYKVAEKANIDRNRVVDINALLSDSEKAGEIEIRKTDEIEAGLNPHDTSVIIYTSGTSGIPKAVMLSAYSIINTARAVSELTHDASGDRLCLAIPMFHSYGQMMALAHLNEGKCVCMPDSFKPDAVVKCIDTMNCDGMTSVGAVYVGVINHPDFKDKVSGKIHYCAIGGGVSTPAQMIQFESAFERTSFINGYGQTEASPLISVSSPYDSVRVRSETVGKAIPGIDVRIQDSDGDFLGAGQIGEVVVKGYNLMNGYYKLPVEQQAIDDDGWLHTGDLGKFDDYGNLMLQGRIKDIIIRGGENISPIEVEEAMMALGWFDAVKVLSAPHYVLGESVEACIVLKKRKEDVSEVQIKQALAKKLSSYKIPEFVFRYKRFPLNENGKLDQRRLKVDALELLYNRRVMELAKKGITCLNISSYNSSIYIKPTVEYIRTVAKTVGCGAEQVRRLSEAAEKIMDKRKALSMDEEELVNVHLLFEDSRLILEYGEKKIGNELICREPVSEDDPELTSLADSVSIRETNGGDRIYRMEFIIDDTFNWGLAAFYTESEYRDWKENKV